VIGHVAAVLVIMLPVDLIALYDSEKIMISVHLSSREREIRHRASCMRMNRSKAMADG
jgi:hypothetical protein